jgi:CRISPR/Cas system-associated exonuclease Cas4 (RecB family)
VAPPAVAEPEKSSSIEAPQPLVASVRRHSASRGRSSTSAAVRPGVVVRRQEQEQVLRGALVHRLFQRQADPAGDEPSLAGTAADLLRPEERADVADVARLALEAARLYRRFRTRPDVADILASGECLYEVPFSYADDEAPHVLVRGVVDCVVIRSDGPPIVLEFKTGAPHSDHDAQVALYGRAIAAALGVPAVSTKVLYA